MSLSISGIQSPACQITPAALRSKGVVIESCQQVSAVVNDFDAEVAGTVLVEVAGLLKECEKARKQIKQPVLDLCRAIDSTAEAYTADLEKHSQRIRGLIGAYNARVEEEQRAIERKRQEELARIERERVAAERKAQEEVARIERERLAAEAEARRVANEAFAKARSLEQAKAAALAAEDAAKQLAAKAKRDAEAAEQARLSAERERIKQAELVPVAPKAAPISGVSVKSVWLFEVVDINELHKANPQFVTLTHKAREINAAISAGARNIPGLRIWEEKGVKVRA